MCPILSYQNIATLTPVYMVSITAKSTYFKGSLFLFFKIFYTLIVHYVITFVFSIGKQPYIEAINFVSYTRSGVSRILFGGRRVQNIFGKVGVFAWRDQSVVRGHAPPRKFFKMVSFGEYFPKKNVKIFIFI